jgi:hypothetical protein
MTAGESVLAVRSFGIFEPLAGGASCAWEWA